jgi:hypothetical protein
MLKSQQIFLAQNPINCQSFSPKFVARMKLPFPNSDAPSQRIVT